jgi:hypothetical protein
MVYTLLHVHINWLWKDTNGNITEALSLSFRPQIIVTVAVTKPQLWKWMIQSIQQQKTQFMTIANCKSLARDTSNLYIVP